MRSWNRHLLALVAAVGFATGATVYAQTPPQTPAAPPGPANAPSQVEPKVLEIVKAACNALTTAKTMSFTAVNTYEKAALNGQPLFYATLNQVTLQRPEANDG